MKHIKIILAALLSLTLTACGDTSTAEVTETLSEVTEDTSSISETVAEETETEITTAEETTFETTPTVSDDLEPVWISEEDPIAIEDEDENKISEVMRGDLEWFGGRPGITAYGDTSDQLFESALLALEGDCVFRTTDRDVTMGVVTYTDTEANTECVGYMAVREGDSRVYFETASGEAASILNSHEKYQVWETDIDDVYAFIMSDSDGMTTLAEFYVSESFPDDDGNERQIMHFGTVGSTYFVLEGNELVGYSAVVDGIEISLSVRHVNGEPEYYGTSMTGEEVVIDASNVKRHNVVWSHEHKTFTTPDFDYTYGGWF